MRTLLAWGFGAATVFSVAMILVSANHNRSPAHWGQFTETSTTCTTSRAGRVCTSTGSWVSDDGRTRFDTVFLDDGIPHGVTVPAGYRDSDVSAGATTPDQVHTKGTINADPWLWIGGSIFAALAALGFRRPGQWPARLLARPAGSPSAEHRPQ